ncbi:MAG: hypothetical protein A2W91_11200 [Bacteroidetes bacterium GWF2_38_335]|nr:MAG: hypothetical protein A2W91_11200 [Bacteroidetes bacterium GWF2_38_335]OFY81736.1 MAG: hypothetical protein A2281_05840 [Bacteroidetes bacterium RIFOXYA12_FULL_38_20]HBS87801.1 peptidylprolyl isomerase [Bacteroidales bacterium]
MKIRKISKYLKNNRLLLIFLFAIISVPAAAQPEKKVIDQVAAVVGNNVVLLSDIENQYIQLRAQGFFSDKDMKCEILEEMLYQKLLLHQADLDSVEISPKEVEDNLNMRVDYYIKQAGDESKLELLYGKPISELKEDFRAVIKDQMLTEKMQSKITADIKISPAEIRNFYDDIPKDSLPEIAEEYTIAQIVIYPKKTKESIKAVKEKLEGFKKRIEDGTPFASLAVLYSQDPGSAKNGGEVGLAGRGDLDPEFAAAAFNLTGNQVSRVVESEFGFHIIQLIEKKGDLINVRHILIKPEIGNIEIKEARARLDSIRNIIMNPKDTLSFEKAVEYFSQDEDTKYNSGLLINNQTNSIRFHSDEMEPDILSRISKLTPGQISAPFESTDKLGKTNFKIVKLISKTEKHIANLKDDYDLIQKLALNSKKQDIINEWIKRKQTETFIRINPPFDNCVFELDGWIK